MPFDGSGNYTPAAAPNFPAISGTTIIASYYNNVINDLATAMNNVLTRDGQGKPSAAINWNGQNLSAINALSAATLALTTPLGFASGGTGVDTSAAANGKLLIGNGSGLQLGNITGDANITVTNNAGGIALSFTGSGGSVSSVDASGGTTGLSFSGGPITTTGTLTLSGTLAIANGGTGATTAGAALTALGGAASGAITASGLTVTTSRLLGRTTAATGAVEELTVGATLSLTAGSLAVASVPNAITFNNGGSGAASGTTYDGAAVRTISHNTIGALPLTPRVQTAGSNSVTPTFTNDLVIRTGATAAITLNNPSGTALDGHGIVIRLKDNGTGRSISFGTQYRAMGVSLPGTTVANKWTYIGMIFNNADTKWDVVSVLQEA